MDGNPEAELLLDVLDRARDVLAWKCGGLDAAGLRATLGPSAITLGGLLKHLARVEDDMLSVRLFGRDPAPPWDTGDWQDDWRTAADDSPQQLLAQWRRAVELSRANVAEALARGGLGQRVHDTDDRGEHVTLRRLVVHTIEEYARHNGHADLIRESVDGLVGDVPAQDADVTR